MANSLYKAVCFRTTAGAKLGNQSVPTGWTSVYYLFGDDFDNIFAAADNVNSKEMALYAGKVTCNVIRLSDMNNPRRVSLRGPSATTGGVPPSATIAADPNNAVRIKFHTALDRFFYKYLRGWEVAFFDLSHPAAFVPTPASDVILQAYCDAVKNQCVHVVKKDFTDDTYSGEAIESYDMPKSGGSVQYASIRRSGRPFGQRHGRKLVV